MAEKKAEARAAKRVAKKEKEEMSMGDKVWQYLKWALYFMFIVFLFKMRIMKK